MKNEFKQSAVQECEKCGVVVEHVADLSSSDLELRPLTHNCKAPALRYTFGCVAQQAGELFHISPKSPVNA